MDCITGELVVVVVVVVVMMMMMQLRSMRTTPIKSTSNFKKTKTETTQQKPTWSARDFRGNSPGIKCHVHDVLLLLLTMTPQIAPD
jgi:hypothetical protein